MLKVLLDGTTMLYVRLQAALDRRIPKICKDVSNKKLGKIQSLCWLCNVHSIVLSLFSIV